MNESSTGMRTVRVPAPSHAVDVVLLRDRIQRTSGLTRAEIARAVGVDRRSLSGFATGEIRPTDSRLDALRSLVDAAEWASMRYGDRAGAVLRGDGGADSPIDLLARGQSNVLGAMREAARCLGLVAAGSVTVTRRTPAREPLYQAAKRAWEGQLDQPDRSGEVRDLSAYEQDLSHVPIPPQAPARPTRRGL